MADDNDNGNDFPYVPALNANQRRRARKRQLAREYRAQHIPPGAVDPRYIRTRLGTLYRWRRRKAIEYYKLARVLFEEIGKLQGIGMMSEAEAKMRGADLIMENALHEATLAQEMATSIALELGQPPPLQRHPRQLLHEWCFR